LFIRNPRTWSQFSTGLLTFAASAVLAFAAASAPSPANASHYAGATGGTGCTGGLNKTDNEKVSFYSGLDSNNTAASNWARSNALDPTDIVTSTHSSLIAATDIRVHDGTYTDQCGVTWYPYGTGVVGMAVCLSLKGSSCEQHQVRLNQNWTNSTTASNRRALAVHEFGHALGLGHRAAHDISVMVQGYPKPVVTYVSHDLTSINAAY